MLHPHLRVHRPGEDVGLVPGLLEEAVRHFANGTFGGRLHRRLGLRYSLSVWKERAVALRAPVTIFKTGVENATAEVFE